MNINQNQLDGLLNVVSKKLGMSPQDLRQQLESGKFDKALNGMNPKDAATFQQVMQNPKIIEQLMSAPQAQALYKKITGDK